jgi:hypothetical protein
MLTILRPRFCRIAAITAAGVACTLYSSEAAGQSLGPRQLLNRVPAAAPAKWEKKRLQLAAEYASMEAALEAFARKTGVSIIAEGVPPPKAYQPHGGKTARDAITELTDAYDYSWETSRVGVILLRKRFKDENSWPDLSLPELRACTSDIVNVLRQFLPLRDAPPVIQRAKLLEDAVKGVPPHLSEQLSKDGVPVRALPPGIQLQVVDAIFNHAFGGIAWQWKKLDLQLQHLSSASIQMPAQPGAPPNRPRFVYLMFPASLDKYIRNPIQLWINDSRVVANASLPSLNPVRLDTPLLQAHTVAEATRLLGGRLSAEIDLAPELHDRRLVVLAQPREPGNILTALVDLQGWSLAATENGDKAGYRVRRPKVRIPTLPTDLGLSIAEALPKDILRSLLTYPNTLNGHKVQFPIDIEQGFTKDPSAYGGKVQEKFRLQADRLKAALRTSLAGQSPEEPVPYHSLSAEQKRLILLITFANSLMEGSFEVYNVLVDNYPRWVHDPASARLVARDGGFGVVGPAGGGMFFRPGPPPARPMQ